MGYLAKLAGCLALITTCGGAATASPIGVCGFDVARLAFGGDSRTQAKCLLQPVEKWGHLGGVLASLPPTMDRIVGTVPSLSSARLQAHIAGQSLSLAPLDRPVSRARGGAASAPAARYFVIHDTSSPWLRNDPFPPDIDTAPGINRLSGFLGPNAVAHFFVNRSGAVATGHDFAIPWRATKLEMTVGIPAKGLFLHIENVQPRRRDTTGGPRNDAVAPVPGLSAAQYDRLALLYTVASVRARSWLIPAFHSVLDSGLSDAHDDPQNFDLNAFDGALARLIGELERNP